MNKQDLIAKIAQDTGITKTNATAAVESFFDGITKSLKNPAKPSTIIARRGSSIPAKKKIAPKIPPNRMAFMFLISPPPFIKVMPA